MNVWSAELSKLAANAFLAQRISSINAITAIAEKTEADVTEVAAAIGLDRRIGARFLNAGIGFGGSCFRKDILNLVYLCEHYGLSEPAEYWAAVLRINDYQQSRFVSTMLTAMFNTVAGKRIALLGAAYKPGTDDTRDSPALAVCRALLAEAADVAVSDPRALENARAALGAEAAKVVFEPDPYAAAAGAYGVAILTEWPCFAELDYERIYRDMVKPAFLFDGRNILDHRKMYGLGFNVYPLGKRALVHRVGEGSRS